jgi:hypothetical protein
LGHFGLGCGSAISSFENQGCDGAVMPQKQDFLAQAAILANDNNVEVSRIT